jgi:uncharacterized membrane protein
VFSSAADAGQPWVTFTPSGSIQTWPVAIGADSMIVGRYIDSQIVTHGFLRTSDGTITSFDAPDATVETWPLGLNSSGDIAGFSWGASSIEGFLRKADGTFTTFQYPGSNNTYARGINARGVIVGNAIIAGSSQAFLRKPDGTFKLILRGENMIAAAINKKGVIAGYSYGNDNTPAFVRARNGEIARFAEPNAVYTQVIAINESGEIVGNYVDSGSASHGFVREPDGTITTFDAAGVGSQETVPASINDNGDIVGYTVDNNGIIHGFVREPSGVVHFVDPPDGGSAKIAVIGPNGRLAGLDSHSRGFVAGSKLWKQ